MWGVFMGKKQIHHYIYLVFICLFIVSMILDPMNLFGSKTDWINQHTVFPDYFRKLFYETGNLIPSFAPNIGGGQNIFNFSYYGLFNPFILFSYLFPMISMTHYIIFMNLFLYTLTGLVLYYWLTKHTKETNIAFFSTILTLFSSSFLFHFHRHFMFVNYMPFLILGLIGIDAYFNKNSKWLLTISTFFMILMSYYYSIVGIVIFILYGIYHYIKKTESITIKSFFQIGIPFLIPIFIGILMASILLLPTAHVILSSRSHASTSITIMELLLPKLNLNGLLYDHYTLGMTAISLVAIVYCILKKKIQIRFLAVTFLAILFIPLFLYLLNGTLYIRDKVLIPFLPFIAFFLQIFLEDLKKKTVPLKKLGFLLAIIFLFALLFRYDTWYFYLDLSITYLCIWAYQTKQKYELFAIPILIISITTLAIGNLSETFVSKEEYRNMFSSEVEKQIQTTLNQEKNLVRFQQLDYTLYTINHIYNTNYYNTTLYSSTYHNGYNSFFKDEFHNSIPNRNQLILGATNNIMFQTFMGMKYVHYSKRPSIGYRKIKDTNIYQNNDVLPIGFATNAILSEEEFDSLLYPTSNEALIGNAIVKTKQKTKKFIPHTKSIHPKFQKLGVEQPNIQIKEKMGKYEIDVKEDTKIKLKLEETIQDDILFIDFKLKNQNSCDLPDQKITINGVMNKLTCKEWQYQNNNHIFHYALSKNKKWNTLDITFGKGRYEIEDIHIATLDYNILKEKVKQVDPWNVKLKNAKGNSIKGEITVSKDGYFVTSIPYDEGFEVFLDGKKIKYEMVNKAFLGFPIKKGTHQIKLVYKAPLLNFGIISSGIGFILFGILLLKEKKLASINKL